MEYASQLLIPIMLGLFLGQWLQNTYEFSALWTVGLAIAGMFGGIVLMYKRYSYPRLYKKHSDTSDKKTAIKKTANTNNIMANTDSAISVQKTLDKIIKASDED